MKLCKGFTLIELMICAIIILVVLGVFVGSCSGCSKILFRKDYTGKVTKIDHLMNGQATVIGKGVSIPSAAFSCAVELNVGSEFVTFSSEDRQFATVDKDDSISVATFKYPPWNLDKAGTHYGGRLLKKYKTN